MEQNTQQNTQPVYQESYDYYTSQEESGAESKSGMPWWGILLIVIGSMGVLSVIIVVVLIVLTFMLTFVRVSRQTPSYMGIDESSTTGTMNSGDTSNDLINTVVPTEAVGDESSYSQDDFGKEKIISGYGVAASVLMVPQGFEPDKESSYSDMIFYMDEDYNLLYYAILPYSTAQDVIDNYTDYTDDDNATISTGSYTNDEGRVFQYLCVESVYGNVSNQEITFAADMGNGCTCKIYINNPAVEETISPEEYFYLLDSDALQFSIEEEQE